MRTLFKEKEYCLYEFDSLPELNQFIKTNEGIIIDEVSYSNCFYCLHIYGAYTKFIGLVGGFYEVLPEVLIIKELNIVIVGFDEYVCIVNLSNDYTKIINLNSIVFKVILMKNDFIVICELGIFRLTLLGEIIWSHSSDVIVNSNIEENYIRVFTEGDQLIILLDNGDIVSGSN